MTEANTQATTAVPFETWTVGNVKITRIVEQEYGGLPPQALFGRLTPEQVLAVPWLTPNYADGDGSLRMSVHAFIIESAGKRIIVDTCVGNDKQRSAPEWNKLSLPFLERLSRAGYPPASIDYVICTHMHLDHVGWNTQLVDGKWLPTFLNARYLFGRLEWEHWTAENRVIGNLPEELDALLSADAVFQDSIKPILDAGLHQLVETNYQVNEEVSLFPTPGHTPGHVSIAINSAGKQAVITGDFTHHPIQFRDASLCSNFDVDPALSEATRRQFIDDSGDKDILVLGTHFATPAGGHIVREGESWRFTHAKLM